MLLLFYPQHSEAATECCLNHNGNYACNSQTGQLYCGDGSISTICSCQNVSQPTLTPTPTLIPTPTPTLQYCAANATYNANSGQCVCNSGYLVSDNTCISDSEYCWNQYGGNSAFDSTNTSCKCNQGYIWNSNNTSCISYNTYCQNSYGSDSFFNNSNNSCSCDPGYAIQNNQCQLITTQTPTESVNTSMPIVSKMPVLPTVVKDFPIVTLKPIKKTISNKIKPSNLTSLHLKKYIPVATSNKSGLNQLFINIWNFIKSIFVRPSINTNNQAILKNSGIYKSTYTIP